MIKFKKGDRIRLITSHIMSAQEGAEAFVVKELYFDHQYYYIDIKWINNKLRKEQQNGGYCPEIFELSCKGTEKCKKCSRRLQCITEEE